MRKKNTVTVLFKNIHMKNKAIHMTLSSHVNN